MSELTPIFVFSVPRSGSTMLGSMLGAGEDAVALPEVPFIGILHYRHILPGGTAPAESIVSEINGSFRLEHLDIGRIDDRFQLPELIDDAAYRRLIEKLVRERAARDDKPGIRYWVEHSPTQSRYVESLLRTFPNAFFLHLVRDGRAVAASMLPLDWGANSVKEAAHMWLEELAYGFTAEEMLGKDRCLRVRYEELLLSPEAVLQNICAFVGLSYDPAMISGGGLRVPKYNHKQHSLVGQTPDTKRISAWREQLSAREIKIFEDVAGPMLLRLGYELSQEATPKLPTFRERLAMDASSFMKRELSNKIANKLRRRL